MIGAILFDVDGTLVDTNDLHAACWREAFRHFNIDLPLQQIRDQIGKGGDNLIPSLLPADIVERLQEEIEEFRSDLFRRSYLPKTRPFPGVCDLLRRLNESGTRIVLATSSRQEELDFHLDRIGCREFVTAATSRDDVNHSKPCGDIFEAALGKLAPAAPERAVVVGDTPWDIQAARRLGLPAVAVRCGGFPDEDLAGASAVYDGPQELAARYPAWLED